MLASHLFRFDVLIEARARIEHPEDMIFDFGLRGAKTALEILQATAANPSTVTVKYDGSPSLIMGWKDGQFVLTDKAGFSAKGYDGLTSDPFSIEQMLMSRKMKDTSAEALAQRSQYAKKISSLYNLLKQVIPPTFKGYVQGDLMWTATPPIVDGDFVFKPVKVEYRVPVTSDLGQQIKTSSVGIVIHSRFSDPSQEDPETLSDPQSHGIQGTDAVVVLPHEMQISTALDLDIHTLKLAKQLIAENGSQIEKLLNPVALADQQLKALPGLFKSYVAHKSAQGSDSFGDAPADFLNWLSSGAKKVTAGQLERAGKWIAANTKGYNAMWQFVDLVVSLKLGLKRQLDNLAGKSVQAQLHNDLGHEGFVSVTPDGVIKLVDRALFMRKTEGQSLTESQNSKTAVWSFLRANPPTIGHKLVADKVAQRADGGDYWLFLSPTQDSKKNPLPLNVKHKFAKLVMKNHQDHLIADPNIKTPLAAANWLYSQGYDHIHMIVGSDRVEGMTNLLNTWNSDSVAAKDGRRVIQVTVSSAGERDPDADDVLGVSATLARSAAAEGNSQAFAKAVGLDPTSSAELMSAVRDGMKVKRALAEDDHRHGTIAFLNLSSASKNQLARWCRSHDVSIMDPQQLHLTLLMSTEPAPQLKSLNGMNVKLSGKILGWQILGESALTLKLHCPDAVNLHQKLVNTGINHKWPNFVPHVSVIYGHTGSLPESVPDFDLEFDSLTVKEVDPNFGKSG
jgi:nicotinic acid mononucleotide adenylyltransferase